MTGFVFRRDFGGALRVVVAEAALRKGLRFTEAERRWDLVVVLWCGRRLGMSF